MVNPLVNRMMNPDMEYEITKFGRDEVGYCAEVTWKNGLHDKFYLFDVVDPVSELVEWYNEAKKLGYKVKFDPVVAGNGPHSPHRVEPDDPEEYFKLGVEMLRLQVEVGRGLEKTIRGAKKCQ